MRNVAKEDSGEEVLGMRDFCKRAGGLHLSTLYRQIRSGHAPRPRKQGGRSVYTLRDLAAYLDLVGRWHPGPFEPPKTGPDALDEDETEE